MEAKHWKREETIVDSFFEGELRPGDTSKKVLDVIIRVFNALQKDPESRPALRNYCSALVTQLASDVSKAHFKKYFHKNMQAMVIKDMEEEASTEAKIASRVLTTIETTSHKNEMTLNNLTTLLKEKVTSMMKILRHVAPKKTNYSLKLKSSLKPSTFTSQTNNSAEDLSFLPVDGNPFLEFIQFAMLDFILNCKRPGPYKDNDERSFYCEVMIPIFKAFGNCTSSLTYAWCEKKATDSDYVWFKNGNILSHSINDTLKNIKSGHDNLKSFISNYRNSSFETIKKVHLFSCQIIQTKLTLVKYSIKPQATWKVVECRSASIPTCFLGILSYIRLFELFAFLYDDINNQKEIFKQLEREHLGIVKVHETDTVAHHLL
ncbi:uncharacterized protein EV154DRAFT_590492 [Mucor mucedo]|uniref:uncharacterized protein n=1 Tax=Mucor mucedo TaxID=29922 RepID=UPI00221F68A1|nr:uncharacterized protein EV154DRAFT_590492 [Mucor mucedo]KAI7890339.1 hypothetical protein EV154DRAFT_590492 [Mucor mucedo]